METVIDQLMGELILAVVVVVSTLATFFVRRAVDAFELRTGIEIEAKHRETLHSAIQTGIRIGFERIGLDVGDYITEEQRDLARHEAMKHIKGEGAGDAVSFLELRDEKLTDMINSELPRAVMDAAVAPYMPEPYDPAQPGAGSAS